MPYKYVIMRVGNRGIPIIFPSTMIHAEVAKLIGLYYASEAKILAGGSLSNEALEKIFDAITPISAGDCEVRVLSCGGKSDTLQLGAATDDKDFINSHPYTGGYLGEEKDG